MLFAMQFACQLENLKTIRSFLRDKLNQSGVEEAQRDLIILAVDEICSNTIEHGNASNPDKNIHLNLQIDPSKVQVDVIDEGTHFNPMEYEEDSLRQLIHHKKAGGMGISLAKRIMDDLKFTTENGKNIFRMVKNLDLATA